MKLKSIGRGSFITALLAISVLAGGGAAAQTKHCEHEKPCGHKHKPGTEACEGSCVHVHAHGPMIFRNTRYDNSYKQRNFSHQRSAYKNSWERRHYR